jgi:hypothetical protein
MVGMGVSNDRLFHGPPRIDEEVTATAVQP